MEFYMSGIETEWWCWSCLQDLLALIGAGVARCPNKPIIHMTNSSFAESSTPPPSTYTRSTYMEVLIKLSSHSLRNDWFSFMILQAWTFSQRKGTSRARDCKRQQINGRSPVKLLVRAQNETSFIPRRFQVGMLLSPRSIWKYYIYKISLYFISTIIIYLCI